MRHGQKKKKKSFKMDHGSECKTWNYTTSGRKYRRKDMRPWVCSWVFRYNTEAQSLQEKNGQIGLYQR